MNRASLVDRILVLASKRIPENFRTSHLDAWRGDLESAPEQLRNIPRAIALLWTSAKIRRVTDMNDPNLTIRVMERLRSEEPGVAAMALSLSALVCLLLLDVGPRMQGQPMRIITAMGIVGIAAVVVLALFRQHTRGLRGKTYAYGAVGSGFAISLVAAVDSFGAVASFRWITFVAASIWAALLSLSLLLARAFGGDPTDER